MFRDKTVTLKIKKFSVNTETFHYASQKDRLGSLEIAYQTKYDNKRPKVGKPY